jgi:THO complex subunit 4
MSTGLDMSLDDMIAKNRKSRGGAGPARGTGSGSGPGPTRRNNPNRKSTRSAPYQSAKVQIRSTSVLSSSSSSL